MTAHKSYNHCVTQARSCGLMDKAPDFGSGDCRFESCHVRVNFCANMNLLWRSPNHASTTQVLLGPPPTTTSLEKQTVIRLFWKYLVINSMSVVISRARAVLVKIYPLEVLPYFILISSYKQQCHKLFKWYEEDQITLCCQKKNKLTRFSLSIGLLWHFA